MTPTDVEVASDDLRTKVAAEPLVLEGQMPPLLSARRGPDVVRCYIRRDSEKLDACDVFTLNMTTRFIGVSAMSATSVLRWTQRQMRCPSRASKQRQFVLKARKIAETCRRWHRCLQGKEPTMSAKCSSDED